MTTSGGERASSAVLMHVHAVLTASAERDPAAIAILSPDRPPLTYGDMLRQVEATARELRRMGIPRDGRVALVLPDGPELAVALLAVKAAAVACPLYADVPEAELVRSLDTLRAQAVIVPAGAGDESFARRAAARLGIAAIELHAALDQPAGAYTLRLPEGGTSSPAAETPPDPSDIAIIMQTSGTTGRPKLVPLTHRNICSGAVARRDAYALTPDDRCLALTPMTHIVPIANSIAIVLSGGSAVYVSQIKVNSFFRWLERFQPTWVSTVPAILQGVLDRAPGYEDVIARHPIRFIRSGGAQLTQPLSDAAERLLRAPVFNGYGLTETSPTLANSPLPPAIRKPGSVGVAAGCEIAIVDESFTHLSPHLIGEIVVRGPNVMSGYLDDPEENATTFTPDGWLRTGDLGYLDEDGYLFVTGRIKEIINRGGQKVAPSEVEAVLRRHPGVAEAAVFAVPDERLGEAVAAAVIPRPGVTLSPHELEAFASQALTWYKVPRQIVPVDRFPVSRTGKVRRVSLARDLGLTTAADADRSGQRFVVPATPVERYVAEVWSEVLGTSPVGVDDHLLAIGGDSLSAARIAARLRQDFGLSLTVSDLLAGQTVGTTALAIETLVASSPIPRRGDRADRPRRQHRAKQAGHPNRTGRGERRRDRGGASQ